MAARCGNDVTDVTAPHACAKNRVVTRRRKNPPGVLISTRCERKSSTVVYTAVQREFIFASRAIRDTVH